MKREATRVATPADEVCAERKSPAKRQKWACFSESPETTERWLDSIFDDDDVLLITDTPVDVGSILEPTRGKRSIFQLPLPDLPPRFCLDSCERKPKDGRAPAKAAAADAQECAPSPLRSRRSAELNQGKERKRLWLQDHVIGVVETQSISPLARVQMRALKEGRDAALKFEYDQNGELRGATCDGEFFEKGALQKLSMF